MSQSKSDTTGLRALFSPKTVAVIGASRDRDSIGAAILANLLSKGFSGAVFPVNRNAGAVQGVYAYRSIADVPVQVDLAILTVPARFVNEVMAQCAAAGVKAAVVISAGFKELGEEGRLREVELTTIAREGNIRVIGPNCLGVLNTDPEVSLDATFAPTWPPRGKVGFLSQSGALGVAILDYAATLNLGISNFASVGNRADVSANDLLEYWEEDPHTELCLLYLESFGNPHKFTRIARRVAKKKPIVVVKSGRSEAGVRAASSHTGSLAGLDVGVDALLHQTGVIRVDSIDEMFNTAMLLANQPLPKGPRIAILTNAGGPGILATDACIAGDLEVPRLSAKLQAALAAKLLPEASVANPVDMIASATPEQYEHAVRTVLASDEVDAALVIFVPPIVTNPDEVASAIIRGAASSNKPVVANILAMHGVANSKASLTQANVPCYPFPEQAASSLSRVVRYARWRNSDRGEIPVIHRDTARARQLLANVADGCWLPARDAFTVLDCYGIRTVPTRQAKSAQEAVEVARELGFPVAVKLASDTLVHKSDLQGVRLGLRQAEDVYDAFAGIRERLNTAGHTDAFDGVVVQPMAQKGVELVIGAVQDPVFGHLMMAGLGGVFVELLKDVSFRVHPLTNVDAIEMLQELHSLPLLQGYRGEAPRDIEAVHDFLLRVSQLLSDFPEIAEIDLNPIMVYPAGQGAQAVDARIRIGTRPTAT